MKKDQSFGILALQKNHDEWQVFVIQQHQGHYCFPKGHPEPGEKPFDTAKRELKEETGLEIKQKLKITPLSEHYHFRYETEKIQKTVTYFPCTVEGTPKLQESEILNGLWLSFEKVEETLTYPNSKKLFCDAKERLIKILDSLPQS